MRRKRVGLAALGVIAAMACAHPTGHATPASLGGVKWVLIDVGGRPAVGAVEQRPYLEFVTDSGRVSGSTGCNRLTGSFTLQGKSLHFAPAATTRMACLDAGVSAQEDAVLAALQSTDGYDISRDTLTLTHGSGRLARFAAAASR